MWILGFCFLVILTIFWEFRWACEPLLDKIPISIALVPPACEHGAHKGDLNFIKTFSALWRSCCGFYPWLSLCVALHLILCVHIRSFCVSGLEATFMLYAPVRTVLLSSGNKHFSLIIFVSMFIREVGLQFPFLFLFLFLLCLVSEPYRLCTMSPIAPLLFLFYGIVGGALIPRLVGSAMNLSILG